MQRAAMHVHTLICCGKRNACKAASEDLRRGAGRTVSSPTSSIHLSRMQSYTQSWLVWHTRVQGESVNRRRRSSTFFSAAACVVAQAFTASAMAVVTPAALRRQTPDVRRPHGRLRSCASSGRLVESAPVHVTDANTVGDAHRRWASALICLAREGAFVAAGLKCHVVETNCARWPHCNEHCERQRRQASGRNSDHIRRFGANTISLVDYSDGNRRPIYM